PYTLFPYTDALPIFIRTPSSIVSIIMNNLITKLLQTNDSPALVPLRLGTGIILAAHGAQKLFGWFGGFGLAATGGFFESQFGMADRKSTRLNSSHVK